MDCVLEGRQGFWRSEMDSGDGLSELCMSIQLFLSQYVHMSVKSL